jgi:hypothetical protein
MEKHIHPVSGVEITGTRLLPGDIIQADDVYDSTSGGWDTNYGAVGGRVPAGNHVVWIRPGNEPQQLSEEASQQLADIDLAAGLGPHIVRTMLVG